MTESKTRIAVRRALAGEPVAQLAAELGLYASGIHRAVAKEREVKRCPTCARTLPKGFATPPSPAQAAYAESATLAADIRAGGSRRNSARATLRELQALLERADKAQPGEAY